MSDQVIGIYKYLHKAGIKHSNSGFKYLIDAICLMLEDPMENDKIGIVYEKIANKYGTNSECIERAIRYTIIKMHLSNKEFIVRASHELMYGKEITA